MSDDYSYLGHAGLGDFSSLFNALSFMIEQALNKRSSGRIVQIVKPPYDANGNAIVPGAAGAIGYVDVLPLVNQTDGYNQPTPHEIVHTISYMRYQSGNGAFISDPVVGDIGHMVVDDRDTSVVRATGAQGNPGSARKNSFSDGTFVPCTIAGAPTQWFAFLAKGFNCQDGFGNTLIGTAQGVVINGVTITLAGDVVTKHGTSLDHHANTLVTAGTQNSGPPP